MKTIFHDKESGTKLEMEGTFSNSKAQLLDNEENVLVELEGSYPEILKVFKELHEEDTQEDIQEGELFVVNNDEFVDLSKLKLRTKEYTPNIKAGDYVKVKEGREDFGAKGFAIVTGIEDGDVILKGIDEYGSYSEEWINNANNVIKIG